MADASALAGLPDRAKQILDLVGELAKYILENDVSPGEENYRRVVSAWNALRPAIIEAGEALPSGPNAVADWIREVGLVSKWFDGVIRQHGLADVLFRFNCDGFNRVADEGRALFKDLSAKQDPFAFVEESTAAETSVVNEASDILAILEEIRAKVESTREHTRHPNASHSPNRMAADAYSDYASIVRKLDKCGIAAPPLPDHRLHPLQTMNYVLQALDDVELALNRGEAYRSLGEIFLDLIRCEQAQATGKRAEAAGLWAKVHLDDDAGRIEALCKARYGVFNVEIANRFCGEVCSHHDLSDYDAKHLAPHEFIGLAKELPAAVSTEEAFDRETQTRLTIDLPCKTVTLDGVTFDVTSDLALRWVKVLAAHPGEWIASPDLKSFDALLDGARTSRLRQYMPETINELIESDTGKGSRLKLA